MRKGFTFISALAIFLSVMSLPATADQREPLSVMTRNLYLGADVGNALALLPDFPKAAQFMWDQMKTTNFEERAKSLAAESARYRPDLIGIQEATIWSCKKSILSKKRVVFDFLSLYLQATEKTNAVYKLVEKEGKSAFNPGFLIPAIPKLTMVTDPRVFQPLFGQDSAACGFTIADALLIRADSSLEILQVGNTEFKDSYSIIPIAMVIYRGFSWADFEYQGRVFRVVTTHLESLFDEDGVPHSARQAKQLVEDLQATKTPLLLIGDLNSDPRDPRSSNSASINPGGQPYANERCSAQVADPRKESAFQECNAYWTLIGSGFEDLGPDSLDPRNFTWGSAALLNGPDAARGQIARELGNPYGFTDRLDYILAKNGVRALSSRLVSESWPTGSFNWICRVSIYDETCFPSDHAGVFAEIEITASVGEADPALDDNKLFPWPLATIALYSILFLLLLLAAWVVKVSFITPISRALRKERDNQGSDTLKS